MEVSVQLHTPGALLLSMNSRYHLIRGWVDHAVGSDRNNVSSIAAQNPVVGNCEHDTKTSACRKSMNVFGYLLSTYLLKVLD
jgi:hypothetical protein